MMRKLWRQKISGLIHLLSATPWRREGNPVRFIDGWSDRVLLFITLELESGEGQIQAIEWMTTGKVGSKKPAKSEQGRSLTFVRGLNSTDRQEEYMVKYQLHPRGVTVATFVDGARFIPHPPDSRSLRERLDALERAFDKESDPTRAEEVLRVYIRLSEEV